jgi:beta-N-acetylhexosaminidase
VAGEYAAAVRIRPYVPDRDEAAVLALWDAALGDRWPIAPAAFRGIVGTGEHFVAEDDRAIGFVATQAHAELGGLLVVLVDPSHRRRGVGRALHDQALEHLRGLGLRTIRLAPGPASYFWPGVPTDLPEAWAFFRALGWTSDERAVDLVLDLATYATPAWVLERAAALGATFAPATMDDADSVASFERAHLPGWERFFAAPFASGEPSDVMVARGPDGVVLGTVLVHGPDAAWHGPLTWARRLGERCGAVSAVGVAREARGRGVGLALVAQATELLRARGLARSYVGWTWLRDWYARLGYRTWMEYHVSRR